MSMGLTQRQSELLRFLRAYLRENGIAPTRKEICVALGLSSKGEAQRLILNLEERGYIELDFKHLARGIKLIEPKYQHGSDCLCMACPGRQREYQKLIEGLQIAPPVAVLRGRQDNFRAAKHLFARRPDQAEQKALAPGLQSSKPGDHQIPCGGRR